MLYSCKTNEKTNKKTNKKIKEINLNCKVSNFNKEVKMIETIYTSDVEIEEIKNFRELFKHPLEKYGDGPAFKYKIRNDKTIKEYRTISNSQFISDYEALGTSLLEMGLKDKKIAIISENRYEWCVAYAAITCGLGIGVPLDKALKPEEIEESLIKAGAEGIIYSKKYIDIINKIRRNKESKVKQFINMDLDEDKFTKKENSFKFLVKKGLKTIEKGNNKYRELEINPDSTSILLFTSATTANSKLVALSQKSICTNVAGIQAVFDVKRGDTFLSFLPLSHIFEGTVGFLYAYYSGAMITYADGLRHLAENIKEYQISCMISVPLLFESIYKNIIKEIEKKGKYRAFKAGLRLSSILMKLGIDKRKEIFEDIHQSLGGNVRLLVSGGAELSKDVQKWYNDVGLLLTQGYGASETSPIVAAGYPPYVKAGTVGKVFPKVKVKIDNPDETGEGEILAKGPTVMIGYYNDIEATRVAIDEDGWFRTGDLGRFNEDAYLSITGRKKTVIVLKNGKNVYPDEIENILNSIPGVKESMVFGEPQNGDKANLKLCAKLVYDKEYFEGKDKDKIYSILWKEVKKVNLMHSTYKYIKKIIITDEELIKTTTKKIKRYEEMKKIEKVLIK